MFYAPVGNIRICEYTPLHHSPPFMTSHSEKCPRDLEKFSALDLRGNFRICEYTLPLMFLDLVNMKEI